MENNADASVGTDLERALEASAKAPAPAPAPQLGPTHTNTDAGPGPPGPGRGPVLDLAALGVGDPRETCPLTRLQQYSALRVSYRVHTCILYR